MTDRRTLLTLAAGLALPGLALAQSADTPPVDQRLTERSVGRPDARVTVIEYFSLTCGHCAAFHRDTWPRVKRELVDTGRVRVVFRDFPLDQLGLAAAGIARSLPPERYEAFISALFANQERWAFGRGGAGPAEELFKLAAIAGMDRATFDQVLVDAPLQRAILEARVRAQQEHNVSSTPTFVFGSRVVPGNMPFERFASLVNETR
jgi:protein-disulfide isomerase